MPNITKRTNKDGSCSYQIRVSCGYDANGKQIMKRTTWKPPKGMTARQTEKELNRFAVDFENKVAGGLVAFDGSIKFQEYADIWLDNAQIAPKTRERYIVLLRRINQAIGHIKLQSIQEAFYKNLKEDGVKHHNNFAMPKNLDKIMENQNITRSKLAQISGVSSYTVSVAKRGDRITAVCAEKIAAALNVPFNAVFEKVENTGGLSDKTVLHHHRLISSILGKAKKAQIIPFNVALEHTDAPKVQKKEAAYLDDKQAQHVVSLLLDDEDIRVKTSILLLLYSGVRRGELCGLEWPDVDFDNRIIHIRRASQYLQGNGITTVPTKNDSSQRTIKMPDWIFDILKQYRVWWLMQQVANGNQWQGSDRLFIQANGSPINPDTINFWLEKFIERNNLMHFTPHSLRHTFSTLQIMAGVNIRTLQARTGHAQASTLVNIYSHAIKTADELATEALDDMLTPKSARQKRHG